MQNVDSRKSEKYLTTMLQLQCVVDDFQQGRTRFFDDNNSSTAAEYTVTPVAGLGLLFRQPPAARYLHDGEVVRCGEKYLLRSDVIYRKLIPLK